jgi:CDP-glycerol glycerophosphotransferase (TagB/SpsB family)
MYKKVIYYRPIELIDTDIVIEDKKYLPGVIVHTENELLKELQNFEMDDKNREITKNIYSYNDTQACQRIVDQMIETFNI